MKVIFVRWMLFFIVGLPMQALTMLLYPFFYLYWAIKVLPEIKKYALKINEHTDYPDNPAYSRIRDLYFHDNDDTHNALTQYPLFHMHPELGQKGLELLVSPDGAFLRRYMAGVSEGSKTSGDCVVAWCFAYSLLPPVFRPRKALRRAAWHYLRNLGTKSINGSVQGWVSARCNNLGVNYCPDGWKGIGQPCTGPQFYTTSALLALAYRENIFWKAVFWLHWLVFGGWYWAISPMIFPKFNKLGYVRDITMRALWVHQTVFGPKWWVMNPIEKIAIDMAEYENALFFAQLGLSTRVPLPKYANSWFSQNISASSGGGAAINVWTAPTISYIRQEAQRLGVKYESRYRMV